MIKEKETNREERKSRAVKFSKRADTMQTQSNRNPHPPHIITKKAEQKHSTAQWFKFQKAGSEHVTINKNYSQNFKLHASIIFKLHFQINRLHLISISNSQED
jgi:hypothetical protein